MRPLGSIQQRGPKSFRVRFSDINGRRYQKNFKTRELAENGLKEGIAKAKLVTPSKVKQRSHRLRSVAECPGVYFLWSKSTGLTKVGHSRSAGRRIASIATQSGARLHIIGFLPTYDHAEAEKFIHGFLKEYRVSDEWFSINPQDITNALSAWFTVQRLEATS